MRKGKLEKEIVMGGALLLLGYFVYHYYQKSTTSRKGGLVTHLNNPEEKGCRNAFQKMLIYRNMQQDMKPDWFGTEEHYQRYKLTDC